MKRQRKYLLGRALTLGEVIEHISAGRYVYRAGRPMHPSWLMNMSVITLRGWVSRGLLREAIPSATLPQGNVVDADFAEVP